MLRQWTVLLAGFGILFSVDIQAREVAIALDGAQATLVLNNPSTISVNYNIACYKADGSGTIINLTSQTIAPNAQVKHTAAIPDSGTCSGSAAPYSSGTDANGKPFYYCSGSNNYASAANACGTGNTFCFPELGMSSSPSSCTLFWVKGEAANEYKSSSCATYGAVTGGMQVVLGNFQSGYARKNSSAGFCSFFYHAIETTTSTSAGAVCCSSPQSGSVCKVTINTAATNAFLSSPSFMGGAAF